MLLEEFLKPLGLSQTALAEALAIPYPRVNKLVHGKRGVTPDTALRLERLFGMEAQFWLKLQLAWDLYQAQHSLAARRIRKIRRLPAWRRRKASDALHRAAAEVNEFISATLPSSFTLDP